MPVFLEVILKDKIYVIDEIERSVHPLLIKELLNKFLSDKETKGQIVFTTHESSLLDQNILRRDEIWFAEKNKQDSTELYPLSEFKCIIRLIYAKDI
jgi:AAA15 family ATPase/GTPase